MFQHFDADVGAAPHGTRAADEGEHHQQVAGHFLGPGHAVIERIAGEELGEDEPGGGPEQDQAHPILRPVIAQAEFSQIIGIACLFQLGHAFEWFVHATSPPRLYGQGEAGGGRLSKPPLVIGLQRAQTMGVTWVSPFVGAERRDASREPWNLIRLRPA